MRIVCEANELQSCLQKILFVVEKSDAFLLKIAEGKCQLSSSSDGISVLASFPLKEEGEGEVAIASKYAPLILSLPPRVELEISEGKVKVRSGKSYYTFPSQRVDTFPHFTFPVDFTLPFSSLQSVLRTALRAVPRTVVTANRRLLDCVHLESKEGRIQIVTTDGVRMFLGEVRTEAPPFQLLLSRDHATLLTKIEGVNTVGVSLSPNLLFLSFPIDLFCALSPVNLPFPDYHAVLQKVENYRYRAKVSVSDLKLSVERLELVGEIIKVKVRPDLMGIEATQEGNGEEQIDILSNRTLDFSIPVNIFATVIPVCPDSFVELHFADSQSPLALQTTQFTYYFAPICQREE